MSVNIRKSVFETNSSSSHAVNIDKSETYDFNVSKKSLREGVLTVPLMAFGLEFMRYRTLESKISYLATQLCAVAVSKEPKGSDVRDIVVQDPRGAKLIETVEDVLGCKVELLLPGGKYDTVYIDHESHGIGMEAFNDDESLKSFLFSNKSYVTTGSDEVEDKPYFIFNDLEQKEEYYVDYYVENLKKEPSIELEMGDHLDKIKIITDSIDVTLVDLDYKERYKFFNSLSDMTVVELKVNSYTDTEKEEERNAQLKKVFFNQISEWEKYQNTLSIKLYKDAKITKMFTDHDFSQGEPDYDLQYCLKAKMPAENIKKLEELVINLSSNNENNLKA